MAAYVLGSGDLHQLIHKVKQQIVGTVLGRYGVRLQRTQEGNRLVPEVGQCMQELAEILGVEAGRFLASLLVDFRQRFPGRGVL
ncbi:hypothetical protein WJX75_006485 [Coccomyxa subellipsoidea]|uniref:Uncharacterized protein n=1 Tax=Coccomyxa subellipsoidea TaxID=248742 RepID=A0ABR2YGS8_9CHLO